ncbi:MAG: AzlD domain-containing protein [Peptococcaceae bacterium]|nr:AzlD domain-containing protein [Peptococcaceae bacterium]
MREDILFIICGMALVTFATRFASLGLFRTTGIPAWLDRWLKHIPAAILTALIVPSLLLPQGELFLSFQNHYLVAGIVSAFIAYRSRNIVATLSIGMAAMFLLRFI